MGYGATSPGIIAWPLDGSSIRWFRNSDSLPTSPSWDQVVKSSFLGFGVFAVGNYVIYYRPTQDALEIVRVLHGARDVEAIFRPGPEN